MDLKEINSKLKEVDISLNTADIGNDSEIMEVSAPTDVEGLYKLVTVIIKDKKTNAISKKLIWSQPLKVVILPIIINNDGINYFLLVSQSRFLFSGKVSIEVNKGFIGEGTFIDDKLLWNYLVDRKIPYLKDYVDILKVVDLGNYVQHPDFTSFKIPVQLVFAKTKQNFNIEEFKINLRVKHDYYNEPKAGPPLHNTQPVLRSLDEISLRLDEILENPDATNEEFYLNDSLSMTAISLTLDYIKIMGTPFI